MIKRGDSCLITTRGFKTMLCVIVFVLLSIIASISHANTQAQNAKILTQTAIQLGIEPAIMLAFGMKESKLRDKAYNANPNGKGTWDVRESHGVLQPTFATAKAFGCKSIEELYDARKCALYAGRFIKYLIKKYSPKYSLSQLAEIYNLGEPRFFAGKTAHAYAKEWKGYYDLFASTPNIDINKISSSQTHTISEHSHPIHKHKTQKNSYIPRVYMVEAVA
jgi:hypothetical protein